MRPTTRNRSNRRHASTDTKRHSLTACADTAVDDLTTYFDSEGMPILRTDIETGDPLTVIGHIDTRSDDRLVAETILADGGGG